MAAIVALVLMPAHGRSPAYLYGTHCAQMAKRHGVGFSIVLPVLTKDIRQFDAVRRSHQSKCYGVLMGTLSRGLVTCARFSRLTCR